MRTVTVRNHTADDLTKRAQIIDAAILTFARDGAKTSVRSIAAQAGVSAGLITHHFGSKEALMGECDDAVLARYRELKMGGIVNPAVSVRQLLGDTRETSIMTAYMLQTFIVGGPAAQRFMDRLMEQMRAIMAIADEKGQLKPTERPDARLRFLAASSLGASLVEFILHPPDDVTKLLEPGSESIERLLAQVEVLTDGVLADRTVLDAVEHAIDANDKSTT